MRKYVKILFIFFIIFSFNSVVYASNQCFYMHGKNNTVVVPKGYSARCYYSYEQTKSSNGGINAYNQIAVDFSKDRIVLSSADSSDKILTNFLYLDDVMRPSNYSNSQFNWDGLILNANSYFTSSEYDKNINGCPKSIYWVDNISQSEKYLGFSASENPNLSYGKNAKYAVYTLNMETDDQIIFLADNENDGDIYTYPESGMYDLEKEKCDSKNIIRNESDGYGSHHTSTTDTKSETLNSCSYYFEFKNHYKDANDTCHAPKITFTYQKKTISGKSSLLVTSDWSDLKLDNIEAKISEVDLDNPNTYSNLSDYLVYKDGNWSCADKIYVVDSKNASVPLTVFGRSRHSEFSGFYQNEITESQTSSENMCISGTKPGTNINSSINLGDKVDVSCEGILGDDLLDYIDKIFTWVKIAVPIIVIIMGSLDFAQAVLQDDKDAMKKATSKFTKRCIIAVAIFFIPTLLSYILHIFNAMTTAGGISVCGIG